MRDGNFVILSASDATSQTGAKVDTNQVVSASFHVYFGDATAAGTLAIQASNDPTSSGYAPDTFTPTHWINIPSASATIATGAPALITIASMNYRWIRAVWTSTTPGTTTITVNFNGLSF